MRGFFTSQDIQGRGWFHSEPELTTTMQCGNSRVWLFANPCTVAHQTPLSLGYSKKNTGVSCRLLLSGNLPDPGIEPTSPASPAWPGWATREAADWHISPRKSQSELPLGGSPSPWWSRSRPESPEAVYENLYRCFRTMSRTVGFRFSPYTQLFASFQGFNSLWG